MFSEQVVPEGWVQTTLGEIGRYLNGRAFKTSEWSKAGRPIIRIQDLTGSNRNPNYFAGEVEDRYTVRPGDLLISWSATLGAYIWDGPEAVLNQHIFKVQSNINKRFHYHLVRHRLAELTRNTHGSGMVHVTKGVFDNIPVAIPESKVVQEQIAQAIDAAEAKQGSATIHLSVARRAVERFRQSVLAAACSGRLTSDWRENNPATFNEVSEIVSACRSERTEVSGRMATMPIIPLSYDLPSLPPAWQWQPLGELAIRIADADHKMPKARAAGIPYISTKDFTQTGIDFSSAKRISQEDFAYLTKKIRPTAGDILISRYGTVGEVRFVETSIPFQASYSIAIVKTTSNDSLSRWIGLCLSSRTCQSFIREHIRASAQPDVGLQHIRQIPIPVAPPLEQVEIMRRAETLFRQAGAVTERFEAATRDIKRSSQAVLAKAFRGDLLTSAQILP